MSGDKKIIIPSINIDTKNIKNDLLSLKEKYCFFPVNYPFTQVFKEQVYKEFDDWAKFYELDGFRFKLIFNDDTITFEPLRNVDKYVIIGILNQ